jgi:HD-like signal output (HDOD) protein
MGVLSAAVLWGGLAGVLTVLALWAYLRMKSGRSVPGEDLSQSQPMPEPRPSHVAVNNGPPIQVPVAKWVEPAAQRKTRMLPRVRQTIEHATLHGLKEWACDFPPLTPIVPRLLSEVRAPDPSVTRICDLLMQDPVLCAELLQLSNSAAISPGRPVNSVTQAVSLLGYDSVLTLAMQGALSGLLHKPVPGGFDHQALHSHGVATGLFAGVLGRRYGGLDLGVCVTAGLLHDLGKLAMNVAQPSLVRELLATRSNRVDESRLAKEERLFGAGHAVVGALLAEHWELPEPLGTVIELHHYPALSAMTVRDVTARRLTGVVMIANQLSKFAGFAADDTEIDVPDPVVFSELGLPERYEEILQMVLPEVHKRLEAFCAQFEVKAA